MTDHAAALRAALALDDRHGSVAGFINAVERHAPAVLDELERVKAERDRTAKLLEASCERLASYNKDRACAIARAEAAERERDVLKGALDTAAWRFDYLAKQFRRDKDQSLAALAATFDEASADARTALAAIGRDG